MRDFYPEDMVLRNGVFGAWTQAAQTHGFLPYDACVVESLDLLKRKSGEEIVDQIYHFKDKSGRDLALRPEMTPSLARMVAARQGALTFPLKWTTIAQCFRYERTTRGRKREHYQWNLDIIGEDSVAAEAEVLATAAQALRLLGLTAEHYRIHISSRALLTELLVAKGIMPEHHAAAFLALDKRGKIPDEAITALLTEAGIDGAAATRIFELLELNTLADVKDVIGDPCPALLDFERLLGYLAEYGLGELIMFDIAVIRGLAYYTGAVFEAFDINRDFRAIFGGGRYDNLLSDIGGRETSGVGLGFGDVVVAELLTSLNVGLASAADSVCAVGFMEAQQHETAIRVATALRRRGQSVDLALSAEKAKAFFGRCGKADYARAVYIGPDDVENQTVRIKDLASRTEEPVALADL